MDGISCTIQSEPPEDLSSATGFDLTPSSSYDSPSEYGTTPPSSPNLDLPLLIVSAPTEEDLKLNCFQDESNVTSDTTHLGLDDEVEVEELISPELSFPEDVLTFQGEIQGTNLFFLIYSSLPAV
jgi:hypothetical protein